MVNISQPEKKEILYDKIKKLRLYGVRHIIDLGEKNAKEINKAIEKYKTRKYQKEIETAIKAAKVAREKAIEKFKIAKQSKLEETHALEIVNSAIVVKKNASEKVATAKKRAAVEENKKRDFLLKTIKEASESTSNDAFALSEKRVENEWFSPDYI